MQNFPLSYQINTVTWNGKEVTLAPPETYEPKFRVLKSLGVNEVMLSGYVVHERSAFDVDAETCRMGALLKSMGMRPAQHHGLAWSYAPLGESQQKVVDGLIQSVKWTANLNSPALVLHVGNMFGRSMSFKDGVEAFEQECRKHGFDAVFSQIAENFSKAAKVAEDLGVKFALENMDRFLPLSGKDGLPKLVEAINSPAVGYCLDSGHCFCCGETSPVEWIGIMGKKLFTTHFHDNRGPRKQALGPNRWIIPNGIDEHMPPGFGTIPWIDVVQALRRTDYPYAVNFESQGWIGMDDTAGFAHAIDYWRTIELLATKKEEK